MGNLGDYASNDQSMNILTDEFRTKDVIWERHYAFMEMYGNFALRISRKGNARPWFFGCIRHAEKLNADLDFFVEDFKDALEKKMPGCVEKFNKLSQTPITPDKYTFEDIHFLKRFYSLFFKVSGWKNITRKTGKDVPGYAKSYMDG